MTVKELDSVSNVRKRLFQIKRRMLLSPWSSLLYELLIGLFFNGLLIVSLIIVYEQVSYCNFCLIKNS